MMCTEPLIHKGSLEETKTCPYPTNYCPTACRMLAFIPCRFIKILVGKQSVYANQNIRRWEFQSQSRPRKIWREMWCRFLLKQCILCLWVCCYGHCIQVLGTSCLGIPAYFTPASYNESESIMALGTPNPPTSYLFLLHSS